MRVSLSSLLSSEHFVHRKVNTGRPDLQTHGRTVRFQSKHNHRHDLFFFKLRNFTTPKLHYKRCSYSITYLLTYSMVQSPSWEANWFAASQEIPRISRNPKVHYHTRKRPPPVSILGQPNPVHIPTSHLLEIHPNIIRPSTPRSPQYSITYVTEFAFRLKLCAVEFSTVFQLNTKRGVSDQWNTAHVSAS